MPIAVLRCGDARCDNFSFDDKLIAGGQVKSAGGGKSHSVSNAPAGIAEMATFV
ncbi:MAG: hypothetical protein OXC26_15690 [Albidovulum sp.]|nr:hypothetical protein [Albidovulum sp.]